MPETRSSLPEGKALFVLIALALAAMVFATLHLGGYDVESIRLAVRQTARTSFVLFLCAFTASSLQSRWPGVATGWLLRNRRWFGLGFAFSHLLHAIALVMFANADSATFWTLVKTPNLVIGGTGYLVLTLLAATSFDGAVRMLGVGAWQRLHKIGVWVLWGNFMISYGKRIPISLYYAIPVLLLIGAFALRNAARRSALRHAA